MALSNISTNSAAYKRWQQKANAMAYDDPQKFRIIMSLADDEFASEQMRKRILNLSRTTAREGREKSFDLASRRLASNIALQRRRTRHGKKALSTAKTLGAINVPLSGMFGYMKYKGDISEAEDIRSLRRKLFGQDDVSSGDYFDPDPQLSQEEITRTNPKRKRNLFRPY